MRKRRNKLIALAQAVTLVCTMMLPLAVPVQAAAAPEQREEIQQAAAVPGRQVLNFNSDWGFYRGDLEGAEAVDFDDSGFANVTVPHTMRLEKKHCDGANSTYKGIGWYRRYFTLGEEYAGKKLNIDFEGVMTDSDVYLNGEKLYTRNGGYVGFSVDITDKVKLGETNVLAVRVSSNDNPDTPPGKPDSNLDFHYYGGIYRDVTLRATDRVYISDAVQADKVAGGGVFVTYPEVSAEEAKVHVNTHVVNEKEADAEIVVEQKLKDGEGQVAASIQSETVSLEAGADSQVELEMTVEEPKLWHPEHPDLYDLETTVYQDGEAVDSVTTRIGIRTIAYKSDGFYINGERLYLRGANRHQAFLNVGDAGSNSMQYRDAVLFRESGFNAVRAAHYPQDPAFLAACDEVGLVVIECQPGWQNFTNNQTFYDRSLRDTREMIRRDRNHPSVVLWEASLNETRCSEAWTDDVVATAHAEYPGDQFFAASDYGFYGEKYEVCYKVQDTKWSSDPSKWVDFNPEKPFFTREWGDYEGSSKALRKEGTAQQNTQILTRQRYLNGNGYSDWGGLDASDRIGGHFLWSFNDYSRGSNVKTLGSGVVDIDRYEKNCFYWLKSMQSADNPIYGPTVFISSDYMADSSKSIMVFSNCDSVKLYQDDELVDEITREDALKSVPNIAKKGGSPIFTFTLDEIREGSLRAEAIQNGAVVATHEVRTPGEATHLEIEVKDRGVAPVADGSDLIPVYVKAVDENGTVVPKFDKKVHISVSGAGELVGKDIPRIKIEDQILEWGIGACFVRASDVAGEITITASADGVEDGTGSVTTEAYTGTFVPDGDHTAWEGGVEKFETEQMENLAIGKTVSVSSQQGGNEAARGVDDDESTRWCADGGTFPQWFMVDLGERSAIAGFQILWEKGNAVCKYTIQVSDDGETWTNVVNMSGNNEANGSEETKMVKALGRYVKIEITSVSGAWASFYEFKIFRDTTVMEVDPGNIVPDEMIEEITATGGAVEDRGTDKLRDGEAGIGTGWLSASKEFPQSVTVEFKRPQNLVGSRIYWEKDSSWYTYDLEVSEDGANWTKIYDQRVVSGQYYRADTFDTAQKNISFVKVTIHNVDAGGDYNIGMAEWVLYGDTVSHERKEFEYASDIAWESANSNYTSVKKDQAAYNGALVLNTEDGKVTFEKGLGADTNSEVVYNVEGKDYIRFESYIGINANAGKQGGEAVFKVYKDDELIYTSPVKMRDDNCDFISLDITGAKKIKLSAEYHVNPDNPEYRYNTHVDWADAKFFIQLPAVVEGVTLDREAMALKVGEKGKLSATVMPEEAENKDVVWSSSDETVAAVDADGLVTALAEGEAVIRVLTKDGSYKAKCKVTVTAAEGMDVKAKLGALAEYARSIQQTEDYKGMTQASKAALEDALAAAEAILTDPDASRDDLDQAVEALVKAIGGLEYGVQKQHLETAIEAAEAILALGKNYDNADALAEAVEAGKAVLNNENASQEEVNQAADAVLNRLFEMAKTADVSSLESLIGAAVKLLEGNYTSDSLKKLQDAIDAAKETLNDQNRGDGAIGEAYKNLVEAILGMRQEGNKAALKAMLAKANEVLAAADAYVAETLEGLADIVAEAQKIYDAQDAAQDVIDEAVKTLTLKVAAARLLGDVDGDGKVTTNDSSALLRGAAELTVLSAEDAASADVNGDGKADTSDAVLILQYAAEKIAAF